MLDAAARRADARLRQGRRLPRHPRAARPPPGEAERGPEDAHPGRHHHRGPDLLRQRRRRRAVDGPGVRRERRQGRGRAGWLDDHPAAHQEPGLQEPEAGPRPQDQGGRARGPAQRRVVQEPHPRGVPEHRLLRAGLVRREGRGRALLRRSRSRSSTSRSRRCWPGSSGTPRATTRSTHPNEAIDPAHRGARTRCTKQGYITRASWTRPRAQPLPDRRAAGRSSGRTTTTSTRCENLLARRSAPASAPPRPSATTR